MPVMDGIAATEIIRAKEKTENSKHLPIIAMTVLSSAQDQKECIAAGRDDF